MNSFYLFLLFAPKIIFSEKYRCECRCCQDSNCTPLTVAELTVNDCDHCEAQCATDKKECSVTTGTHKIRATCTDTTNAVSEPGKSSQHRSIVETVNIEEHASGALDRISPSEYSEQQPEFNLRRGKAGATSLKRPKTLNKTRTTKGVTKKMVDQSTDNSTMLVTSATSPETTEFITDSDEIDELSEESTKIVSSTVPITSTAAETIVQATSNATTSTNSTVAKTIVQTTSNGTTSTNSTVAKMSVQATSNAIKLFASTNISVTTPSPTKATNTTTKIEETTSTVAPTTTSITSPTTHSTVQANTSEKSSSVTSPVRTGNVQTVTTTAEAVSLPAANEKTNNSAIDDAPIYDSGTQSTSVETTTAPKKVPDSPRAPIPCTDQDKISAFTTTTTRTTARTTTTTTSTTTTRKGVTFTKSSGSLTRVGISRIHLLIVVFLFNTI